MSHETVAVNSKLLAKKYAGEGNFGRAFSHYLVALKLKPEWKTLFREEFSVVLCKWGSMLDERKRFNDLFTCYEQAIELFPDDTVILNNLGAHLIRCGLLKEAAHYFRKCLTINPHFIRASHNLENVSNLAVERWHFRMLNDQHRNEAYRESIIKKIRQGFGTVLDVGTGSGILSLFSSEGKAKKVYACDSSAAMVEIAQRVFRVHNALDVKLINKHSTELRLPEDINEKVSLLVTEIFDAGLLGEGILDTLSHAWKCLLLPPRPQAAGVSNPNEFGVVVPFGASVYVTGVELDAFANDIRENGTTSLGFFETLNVLRVSESYDTHNLTRAPFRSLTQTEKIFEVDFNDPDAVEELLTGRAMEVTLKCKSSGRLDCFAVWFDLYLDEDISLSTSPLSRANTAWDQAVFPLPASMAVEGKQDVKIKVSVESKQLRIRFSDSRVDGPTFEASEDVIKLLNNKKLAKVFRQAANELSCRFRSGVSVLDCYAFPLFGLLFSTERRDRFRDELVCFAPTENDRRLIKFLSEKNGLEVDVLAKTETSFEDCIQERRFDVVLLDLVDFNGEIKDGVLLQLNYLKSLLKPGGIILPEEAFVIGQLIYSDWLLKVSRVVNDSVTCGYNIAEYINIYQVRHFIDFDLNSVENSVCSEPLELFSLLDVTDSVFERAFPRLPTAFHANAFVYWLRIKFTEGCDEISTNNDISYHQAAILFSEIKLPESIQLRVIRSDGLFNIEL